MRFIFLGLFCFCITLSSFAQKTPKAPKSPKNPKAPKTSSSSKVSWSETSENLIVGGDTIFGSLILPKSDSMVPVVLIIAGSGPTDRNGNNPMMKNNSLRMLAEGLANLGIASLRYDKRGIAESWRSGPKEEDLRFESYVKDAKSFVNLLKLDARFSEVIVIGHSEGSLIGMIVAVNSGVKRYVSLAGTGRPADVIILDQLKNQPPQVLEAAKPVFESLKAGKTVEKVDPLLNSFLRPSVQPYMMSWMKYDPSKEIKRVRIPSLIIQGTTDIQVSTEDAKLLSAGQPAAQLKLIEGMNHILKLAPSDPVKNQRTYMDPKLPLAPELVPIIYSFIKGL